MRHSLCRLAGLLLLCASARAQSDYSRPYSWQTLAGVPPFGFRDGTGSAAQFAHPYAVAVAPSGAIYVADTTNCVIRAISTSGVVTTLAGQPGVPGYADGTGAAALFAYPTGITVGAGGNLYVADMNNEVIRQVTPAGVVTTVAGSHGTLGSADGTGTAASFANPAAIVSDSSGNLYVTDSNNLTIRKITPGYVVTTLAGSVGISGSQDGTGTAARFAYPWGIGIDGSGNLYIADINNQTIRKITPAGLVSTLAGLVNNAGSTDGTGSAARFHFPTGVAVTASGNIAVTDSGGNTIRLITPAGVVTTLAGSPSAADGADGTGAAAHFNRPSGVAADGSGNLYVADSYNATIRRIAAGGVVTTLAGTATIPEVVNGSASVARFDYPVGLARDAGGNAYVTDWLGHTVRKVTPAGVVSTIAGTAGTNGSHDGVGTAALFDTPMGIAVDASGVLYVADSANATIRKIAADGTVTTLAGTAGATGTQDGIGAAARFDSPQGIAIDGSNNLYVADTNNHTIRKITPAGVVSTFAGAAGVSGAQDGALAAARFSYPSAICVEANGAVYVADSVNSTIRKISGGIVSTLAGSAGNFGSADGIGAAASFYSPGGVAVDGSGNVFVSDSNNHLIREISPAGVVTTIGGAVEVNNAIDGVGLTAQFNTPMGIASDAAGNLLIADTYNHVIRTGVPHFTALAIGSGPQSQSVTATSSVVFSVTASGTGTLSYQWKFNGANLSDQGGISGSSTASLTLTTVQVAQAGTYSVVVTDATLHTATSSATLAVSATAPTITAQPASQTVALGSAASFSVTATGAPTYQWTFNGAALSGATNASYAIASVQLSSAGAYRVIVTNGGGTATSAAATLTVVAPPTIDTQPAAASVTVGNAASFSVSASGSATYQWTFNGAPIAGATSASYAIDHVQFSAAGAYAVNVTNPGGTVTSQSASLTVLPLPPTISSAPASQAVNVGAAVSFSVTATGSPAYQWSFNGAPISGATSSTYSIAAAQVSAAGAYAVTATNAGGSVASPAALLTVTAPFGGPSINSQPSSFTAAVGGTVVIGVNATSVITSSQLRALTLIAVPALTYQWYFDGALLVDGNGIHGATTATLVLSGAGLRQGSYACLIANGSGATFSQPAALTVMASSNPGRLINVSGRAAVGTGADILIAGFIVGGRGTAGSQTILMRGSGPALASFGLVGALPDPQLDLYRLGPTTTLLATNVGWAGNAAVATAAAQVGAFPWTSSSSHDAALLQTLAAGSHTANISGQSGDGGVALLEIYDTTPAASYTTSSPRLTNVSVRARVGTGSNILIAGFVIGGDTARTVLIRASGPALRALGMTGTLSTPQIQLYRLGSNAAPLATNAGWAGDAQVAAAATTVGAFSWGSEATADAALLLTLPPGGYTANVSGLTGDTGVALIEVYDLD